MSITEVLVISAVLILAAYSVFHCIGNTQLSSNARIIWFLVIMAIPVLGSIAYILARRIPNQRMNTK